jgi:hypothetical protein
MMGESRGQRKRGAYRVQAGDEVDDLEGGAHDADGLELLTYQGEKKGVQGE